MNNPLSTLPSHEFAEKRLIKERDRHESLYNFFIERSDAYDGEIDKSLTAQDAAEHAQSAGIYSAALNDMDKSVELFSCSSEQFHTASEILLRQPTESVERHNLLSNALLTALLSGDTSQIEEMAMEVLDVTERNLSITTNTTTSPQQFLSYYHYSLAAIVVGNKNKAETAVDAVTSMHAPVIPVGLPKKAVDEMLKGMLNKNTDLFIDGLDGSFKTHYNNHKQAVNYAPCTRKGDCGPFPEDVGAIEPTAFAVAAYHIDLIPKSVFSHSLAVVSPDYH